MAKFTWSRCTYCCADTVLDGYCVECESSKPQIVEGNTDAPKNNPDIAYEQFSNSFDPTIYPNPNSSNSGSEL